MRSPLSLPVDEATELQQDPLDRVIKICYIAVLVCDVVFVVDILAHGNLLYKPRWFIDQQVKKIKQGRAAERRRNLEIGTLRFAMRETGPARV